MGTANLAIVKESDVMAQTERERWLAEPEWLQQHLHDPLVRVVDMRGAVQTTTGDDGSQHAAYRGLREDYLAGHIPGAIYLDWTEDIVDLEDPVPAQVAPPSRIAAILGNAGIGDDTLVVAYDTHPTSQFATRLWWVLRYYGHDQVKVLNAGLKRWQREQRPLNTAIPAYARAIFTPRAQPAWRATAGDIVEMLGNTEIALADARDAAQYTNAARRGPRGGHIPGALHIPRETMVDDEGLFRPNEELAAAVAAAGLVPEQHVVAYCNGGVAATSVLFGLSLLGFPRLTNYDGSWNEWSHRADLPVEG